MASRAAGAGYRSHIYTDALRMFAGFELIVKSGCTARLRDCKQICRTSSLYDFLKNSFNSRIYFSTNRASKTKTTSYQNAKPGDSKPKGKPIGTAFPNPNQSQTRSFHTFLKANSVIFTGYHLSRLINSASPSISMAESSSKSKSSPISNSSKEAIKQNAHNTNPSNSSQIASKLSQRSRERSVPASRVARMANFGGLALNMTAGAVSESLKRSIGLKEGDPMSRSVIFSDDNIERLVDTLCKVRGAALKIGQMLSLQDEALLNPKLLRALERVRESADFMPVSQVHSVLRHELGADWSQKLELLGERPFAAASIGEVHLVRTPSGQLLALKIQYPGVAKSIKSDIDNLLGLLKVWDVLPKTLFVDKFAAVMKRELAHECDYQREASFVTRFADWLRGDAVFEVPAVYGPLSTRRLLATSFVGRHRDGPDGGDDVLTLDKCADLDQDTRDYICSAVMRLTLNELLDLGCMQTDPNWANFLYNPRTRKISLIDFGASREFSLQFVENYINIIRSGIVGDKAKILDYSVRANFLSGYESPEMREAHVEAVSVLSEAMSARVGFDFSSQSTTRRIHRIVPVLLRHRLVPPPEETYSLHRKLSGVFLLAARLRARVNCARIFDEANARYVQKTTHKQ